jgi:hypothetical protein
MDCLQPAISRQLALLVNSITAERRQAVLEIARTSNSWHDFLDVLQRGGFPLPESVRRTRVGKAGARQALMSRQLAS